MKTTKITIKNLFGIRETTLDGKSVEISGPKGSGKTSVLDAIRYGYRGCCYSKSIRSNGGM